MSSNIFLQFPLYTQLYTTKRLLVIDVIDVYGIPFVALEINPTDHGALSVGYVVHGSRALRADQTERCVQHIFLLL